MQSSLDLAWLAGLLEGEGCFYIGRQHGKHGKIYTNARISLVMTDRDSVERAATIMGSKVGKPFTPKGGKIAYRTVVCGAKCAGVMMSIYGLMSERRQAKIRECLAVWKSLPGRGRRRGAVPSPIIS